MPFITASDLPSGCLHPEIIPHKSYENIEEILDALDHIYQRNIKFAIENFKKVMNGDITNRKIRVTYPLIQITTEGYFHPKSHVPFGHISWPGVHEITVTHPHLYRNYLRKQISQLMENYNKPIYVGESNTPIPIQFCFEGAVPVSNGLTLAEDFDIRTQFDVPDLDFINDYIANGTAVDEDSKTYPLALFDAPRVDYSLHRLAHYTATHPRFFQSFVLFTNYQFYVEKFIEMGEALLKDQNSGYKQLVLPGNLIHEYVDGEIKVVGGVKTERLPQMPAYHLVREDNRGITFVNIGVGPSNAKTITDHIAVLRPDMWLMLGHCAGLRSSQRLGDYVLAHAYVRNDKVLDEDLPLSVPIPALAEVQIAIQQAVAQITEKPAHELKQLMRTGTVVSVDNRNWELKSYASQLLPLSQARAIALDMESATIAANGFRLRVPYGTLLCVSDKPLHGEIKLPGMASSFYRGQVDRHLMIGIRTMEILREASQSDLHSRKLRSFYEPPFL